MMTKMTQYTNNNTNNNNNKKMSKIRINISGLMFETYVTTLERFPETLLGSLKTRNRFYIPKLDEFFFNRNRESFDAILFYYQSHGILTKPKNVPEKIFYQELKYFKINPENSIYAYCDRAQQFLSEESFVCKRLGWKRRIGRLVLHPSSSTAARLLSITNTSFLILSIAISCISSLSSVGNKYLDSTKHVCYLYLTMDYIIRFLTVRNKKQFLASFLSMTDLMAIIPFYVQCVLELTRGSPTVLSVVQALKVLRLTRLLRITRFSRGMRALLFTLKASWTELQTHITVGMLINIFFASLLYFFEDGSPGCLITSIPESLWWSINTFTTVGYGDIYPVTAMGKVIGSLCAICGIIFIGLPVYFLVSNFLLLWEAMNNKFGTQNSTSNLTYSVRRKLFGVFKRKPTISRNE